MNTGIHEAIIISEVLRSNASMIDHYNMYLNSCQDQQLRSLLYRQQRHSLDSFQRLTQMMQSHGMDTSNIPMPTTMSMTGGSTMTSNAETPAQYGSQWTTPKYSSTQANAMPYSMQQGIGSQGMSMSMPSQSESQLNMQMGMPTSSQSSSAGILNDRSIAEGALQFHKLGADATTRAALESSEPHIRAALTNMSRNCIEMAYEVYNYMSQRGWYQLPTPPQSFIAHSTTQQHQQYSNQ